MGTFLRHGFLLHIEKVEHKIIVALFMVVHCRYCMYIFKAVYQNHESLKMDIEVDFLICTGETVVVRHLYLRE